MKKLFTVLVTYGFLNISPLFLIKAQNEIFTNNSITFESEQMDTIPLILNDSNYSQTNTADDIFQTNTIISKEVGFDEKIDLAFKPISDFFF
jgi:hypothetical protein